MGPIGHVAAMPPKPLPEPGPITNIAQIVQPVDSNPHGTLFGGEAMRFMDEAAAIAAIRYTRGSVVTAHVDAVDFRHPVPLAPCSRLARGSRPWDAPRSS